MRLFSILIGICISISTITAQDWQPFVFGKKYYYGQTSDEGLRVHMAQLDSSLFTNDGFRYFHPTPCPFWGFPQFLESYPDLNNYLSLNHLLFFRQDESAIYYYSMSQNGTDLIEFEFRPKSRPGDSWVWDVWNDKSLTLMCTDETTTSLFGSIDSVRIFQCLTSPYDTLKFYLSKSHGLFSFPPLQNFEANNPADFDANYILIGLHDSLSSLGYKQPLFEDYFALNPGDILYWKSISIQYIPEMRHDTAFYIDTIMSIIQSPDTIKYVKRRAKFNSHGKYLSSETDIDFYFKAREGKLLESQPGWFTKPDIPFDFDPYYGLIPLRLNFEGNDTITSTCLQSAFYDINDFDCTIQPFFDNSETFCYTTGIGMTYQFYGGIGGNNWATLIGSVVAGIPSGIVEIPTSLQEMKTSRIQVYPNPVSDMLSIDIADLSIQSFELYDLHGRLIMRERYVGSIDLSALRSGFYLLKLIDPEQRTVAINRIVRH